LRVPIALKQIIAFTKRDFYSWATYRTAVITQLINIVIGVLSWGVRASYVQRPVQELYGSDYISFLIVGVAIGNLIMPLVRGVERRLDPGRMETILMTNMSTIVFVLGNVMWNYIFSVITFVPYLVIGILVFGAQLNVNIAATLLAFLISAGILTGLAMISAGLRFVTKSTDPITWAITVLQNLFSGIAFPVVYLDTIFFPGVSTISWFLPQTWVYHLCRLAMLTNPSLTNPEIFIQFLKGLIFAIVLFPIGYKTFQWGLMRAKREGTLGHY
jgi:ABC-type multidrug transport system permease subunit